MDLFKGMDIYLIDQILKGRYSEGEKILDAGAGSGRNLNWFLANKFDLSACDQNPKSRDLIQARYLDVYPESKVDWKNYNIENLGFPDAHFDHVICNAVLHFASDKKHMLAMWQELVRVLKPGGSILIRTCSDIGIEQLLNSQNLESSVALPDGSFRYLMTRKSISECVNLNGLTLLEHVKSTNVSDLRVMTTLVLSKD